MGFLGMDVVAIRHLARQLDTQASEAELAVRELTSVLAQTSWVGADRTRFTESWESQHAPAMRRTAQLLREAAELARNNANAQERKSSAR